VTGTTTILPASGNRAKPPMVILDIDAAGPYTVDSAWAAFAGYRRSPSAIANRPYLTAWHVPSRLIVCKNAPPRFKLSASREQWSHGEMHAVRGDALLRNGEHEGEMRQAGNVCRQSRQWGSL
jgi:hypothetical protein